jgi:hypothetical protein
VRRFSRLDLSDDLYQYWKLGPKLSALDGLAKMESPSVDN